MIGRSKSYDRGVTIIQRIMNGSRYFVGSLKLPSAGAQ